MLGSCSCLTGAHKEEYENSDFASLWLGAKDGKGNSGWQDYMDLWVSVGPCGSYGCQIHNLLLHSCHCFSYSMVLVSIYFHKNLCWILWKIQNYSSTWFPPLGKEKSSESREFIKESVSVRGPVQVNWEMLGFWDFEGSEQAVRVSWHICGTWMMHPDNDPVHRAPTLCGLPNFWLLSWTVNPV